MMAMVLAGYQPRAPLWWSTVQQTAASLSSPPLRLLLAVLCSPTTAQAYSGVGLRRDASTESFGFERERSSSDGEASPAYSGSPPSSSPLMPPAAGDGTAGGGASASTAMAVSVAVGRAIDPSAAAFTSLRSHGHSSVREIASDGLTSSGAHPTKPPPPPIPPSPDPIQNRPRRPLMAPR